MKKLILNVSIYKLTEKQTRVIGNRLNFAVTPDKPAVEEFVIATEQARRSLLITKSEQLRSQVAGILKSAKLSKPNINKKESLKTKKSK